MARRGRETVGAVTGACAMPAVPELPLGARTSSRRSPWRCPSPPVPPPRRRFPPPPGTGFRASGTGFRAPQVRCAVPVYLFGGAGVLLLVHLAGSTRWEAAPDRPGSSVATVVTGVGTPAVGDVSRVPSARGAYRYTAGFPRPP
ncbi:hypothetical protein CP967_08850 [Streptomyces nitrosporeus]|uniref:Uncharacterized protein n=1 Tax=Streptomyces nitrosporeus TaxID=28894 RepID=A0A5J6F6T1_9ACTN|nr:hypothetical protein CP967_08850 [Streptomyces nitrosporeus]